MAGRSACMRLPLSSGALLNIHKPSQTLHFWRGSKGSSATAYELNKKGTDEEVPEESLKQKIHYCVKNFVPEAKKLIEEQKIVYSSGIMLEAEHGNYEVAFSFNDKKTVDSWIVTADKDNNEGNSSANFELSQNRTGLFWGKLSHEVPKDGKTKYAGYANITCPKVMKSFRRETRYDWSLFNCLVMKIRGDGRAYNLVIGCDFQYDVNWLNRWTCPLFTRGGPYWQVAKIPFSKFYVSHHGRIQDKQQYIPLSIVNRFGITVADAADGPFCLEIDNISLMYDVNLSGKHAYELYQDRNFQGQT